MATRRRGAAGASINDSHELPSWLFDIDVEDEENHNGESILQELEIDPAHIFNNVKWVFLAPFHRALGKTKERHPLLHQAAVASAPMNKHSIDFWGPCLVVSLYGVVLWSSGKVQDVSWIFAIWTIGAMFNHMVCRATMKSSLMIHVAVLGYSVISIIPVAIIVLLAHPTGWLASLLEIVFVLWTAYGTMHSYNVLLLSGGAALTRQKKIKLLIAPVVLMELYMVSLLPSGV